jgi:long-chain acyl-CoA synthetase
VHPLRVETALVNESPYISQAVIVGSGKNYVGALVYPDSSEVASWAEQHQVTADRLMTHPEVLELFASEIARINPLIDIKYERVRRAVLADREPSLDGGELTPSGKLVRKVVMDNFGDRIDWMFAAEPPTEVIQVPQEQQRMVQSEA